MAQSIGGNFNLSKPSSHCPYCKKKIGYIENIPLVSFIILKGKCKKCNSPISFRYPLIELFSGVLLVFLNFYFPDPLFATLSYIFLLILIALTFIDLDMQLLPNLLTFPLIGMGLLVNLFGVFTDIHSALLGSLFGYLILWSIYWIFKLLTQKEGMGYGDFKLLSGIGSWLGWQALLPTLVISSLAGSLIGLGLIFLKINDPSKPIPFGPFLAIGAVIYLFYGNIISNIIF